MRGLAKGMEGSLQLTCEPGREGDVDQQTQSGVADRRTTHEGLGEQPWGPGVKGFCENLAKAVLSCMGAPS